MRGFPGVMQGKLASSGVQADGVPFLSAHAIVTGGTTGQTARFFGGSAPYPLVILGAQAFALETQGGGTATIDVNGNTLCAMNCAAAGTITPETSIDVSYIYVRTGDVITVTTGGGTGAGGIVTLFYVPLGD